MYFDKPIYFNDFIQIAINNYIGIDFEVLAFKGFKFKIWIDHLINNEFEYSITIKFNFHPIIHEILLKTSPQRQIIGAQY